MERAGGRTSGEPRFHIATGMVLIAGLALGLFLAMGNLITAPAGPEESEIQRYGIWPLVWVLGGLSLAGPPILLWTARKRVWGAGRFLWFVQGTATWLLWPPVIYRVSVGTPQSTTAVCYFFGTPPMALYVALTLLAGGYLRRSRRRRLRRSWQETFGLLLGLVWACTGLYVLSLFYRDDFLRK